MFYGDWVSCFLGGGFSKFSKFHENEVKYDKHVFKRAVTVVLVMIPDNGPDWK